MYIFYRFVENVHNNRNCGRRSDFLHRNVSE